MSLTLSRKQGRCSRNYLSASSLGPARAARTQNSSHDRVAMDLLSLQLKLYLQSARATITMGATVQAPSRQRFIDRVCRKSGCGSDYSAQIQRRALEESISF